MKTIVVVCIKIQENITNKMKCNKCNYEWETKSKLKFITCPSCMEKTLNTSKPMGGEEE